MKKAYYKLAKQYHPDTNKDDPKAAQKFQEAQQAYDTLRDPQKRGLYDQLGHAGYQQMEAGGGPGPGGAGFGGGPFGAGGQNIDPEDLFQAFFGGRARGGAGGAGFQNVNFADLFGAGGPGGGGGQWQRAPSRGADVHTVLRIGFLDAMRGATQRLDLSGVMPGGAKEVEVVIPAGVDTGSELRLAGSGAPGPPGKPAGDLLVMLQVMPSGTFEREGFDLSVDVPVDMVDAALGASVE